MAMKTQKGHPHPGPAFGEFGDATLALSATTPTRGPNLPGFFLFHCHLAGAVTVNFCGADASATLTNANGQPMVLGQSTYHPAHNPADIAYYASGAATLTFHNAR